MINDEKYLYKNLLFGFCRKKYDEYVAKHH